MLICIIACCAGRTRRRVRGDGAGEGRRALRVQRRRLPRRPRQPWRRRHRPHLRPYPRPRGRAPPHREHGTQLWLVFVSMGWEPSLKRIDLTV